jgi:excisionase family DNA binding protein
MRNLDEPALGSSEKFYTLSEVAELLNVSRTTVYRWRQRGLGVVRIHGVVRIGELSLQQFIARHYAQETQAVPA